jgi:hypothetical protein
MICRPGTAYRLPSRSGSSAAKALRHRADDAAKPSYAHNVLTSIEENGEPLEILRDNMPFGDVGKGEFGTYFIGYARSPHRIERMLENMFIGLPPGNYDRLLDFSRAVTGSLFFIPSASFLDTVTPDAAAATSVAPAAAAPEPPPSRRDGSLGIGSLKKGFPMNNLHRELAPISEAAWAGIEEEAARTLKRHLAARRVVDMVGPSGPGLSASRHGPCLAHRAAGRRHPVPPA